MAKLSPSGLSQAFETGYCFRSAAKFWLLGTIGQPKQLVRNVRNLIVAPVREHSRKPPDMHRDLDALWPGPRCELFARESRKEWSTWEKEVGKFTRK